MGICLSHGKAFKVVWETPDAEVLEVQFEDRQYAVPNTASVSIAKVSGRGNRGHLPAAHRCDAHSDVSCFVCR